MLSVIILTKNEEKHITDCLRLVAWADEIIVIDDYSHDRTASLAKASGAIVYSHNLDDNFAAQRNFGLTKAKGEWVLFIDADEEVSQELQKEIQGVVGMRRNRYIGYLIGREDILLGHTLRHGETANSRFLRLAKRDAGKWEGNVHEVWQVTGHIGNLHAPLIHHPHESISEFLDKINFYTSLRAQELYKQRVTSNWFSIILYTKGKFFKNYLLYRGFQDGIPGIISSLMMSFHSFLVRSKLWLLIHK